MTVISFQHRFVFIKTQKTAGTSIEIDLARHLGPEAVVTPVKPAVEGHEARHDVRAGRVLSAHADVREIRDFLGAEVFAGMAVLCIERELVDKCLSHFHTKRNSSFHNPDGAYTRDWAAIARTARFRWTRAAGPSATRTRGCCGAGSTM